MSLQSVAGLSAVVTAAALSVGYMIFNDYVAPTPDLTGSWKFTMTYEDTALNRYEGLQVTYQALLVQQALDVSGSGENCPTGAQHRTRWTTPATGAQESISPDILPGIIFRATH